MKSQVNKSFIRKIIFEALQECSCEQSEEGNIQSDESYLAPDVVGSINNANIDKDKNVLTIDFTNSKNNAPMKFISRPETFHNWAKNDEFNSEESNVQSFLRDFLQNAQEKSINGEEQLDEIIDEFGNLIGNNDLPSNATNSMAGLTKFDTEKTIKQTLPVSNKRYTPYGLGYVLW